MHLLIYFTFISSLLLNGVSKLVYFPPGGPDGNVFLNQKLSNIVQDIFSRDLYTACNRFVSENNDDNVGVWSDFYVLLKAKCLTIPTQFWISQPTDWNTTKFNINNMKYYNAKMYWRSHSLMRHKASIATSCWDRESSVYTSMTIVQIYHFPGEPFRIPCYICEKRSERDGRPKVFYIIENRNIFDVNFTYANFTAKNNNERNRKIVTVQEYVTSAMGNVNRASNYAPVYYPDVTGIEWQMDQMYGGNVLTNGGDGLYMNPTMTNTVPQSNYGTFFCMKEKAEPNDMPQVIVNVDVLTKSEKLVTVNINDFNTRPPADFSHNPLNLKCSVVWQQWSCPVCKEKSSNTKQYRLGFASILKIHPNKPIIVQNLDTNWDEWRMIEGYLSTSPYRENGIPLYSSLWLSFPVASNVIRQMCVNFKDLYYLDAGTVQQWSCDKKLKCEKKNKEEVETSLVDTDTDQRTVPDTPATGDGLKTEVCPIDILKHETIQVMELDQKELLFAERAYKFVCKDSEGLKVGSIVWKVDKLDADYCRKNDSVFIRDNILHVHRSGSLADTTVDYTCYRITSDGNKHKRGFVTVTYYVPYDWRPFIVNIVIVSIVVFLTCPLCAWCARGVRDVTKASFELVKAGAIAAADAKTGGLAGMLVDQMEEKQYMKEEQKAYAQEQMLQQKMDRMYAKQQGYY